MTTPTMTTPTLTIPQPEIVAMTHGEDVGAYNVFYRDGTSDLAYSGPWTQAMWDWYERNES